MTRSPIAKPATPCPRLSTSPRAFEAEDRAPPPPTEPLPMAGKHKKIGTV